MSPPDKFSVFGTGLGSLGFAGVLGRLPNFPKTPGDPCCTDCFSVTGQSKDGNYRQ